MSMDLKLSLKQVQKLVLTPNLQLAIKLLQLSRLELQEHIQQELLENPMIEEILADSREDEKDIDNAKPGNGRDDAEEKSNNLNGAESVPVEPTPSREKQLNEEIDWERYFDNGTDYGRFPQEAQTPVLYENFVKRTETLQDHLNWQLQMTSLDDRQRRFGYIIIGNLEDDGYLAEPLENIRPEDYSLEEAEVVLKTIQTFDPVGVGARDLKECLFIQLEHFEIDNELVKEIIGNHLSLLERKQYQGIAKTLGVTTADLKIPLEIIEALEPKPGREFSTQPTHYVVPDVYVFKVDDEYIIQLNDEGLPRLRISHFYQNLFKKNEKQDKQKDDTKEYVDKKLRSALWLMKSVEQRQRTIYKVAESIVKKQREFFDKGLRYLKPMILRDVAEDIEMHESTVSRVSTNKYLHCQQGVFELKFFFHSGIASDSGEDVSSLKIKELIKDNIAGEDSRKPLSDQKLTEILESKLGVKIARRTVAKYRIDLNIPSSTKRKAL